MKFFAITLAAFAAVVAAHDYETCEVVTVTQTVTEGYGQHTPSAPGPVGPTAPAPYPVTSAAPYPSVPAPSGTGVPVPPPAGTGVPVPPPAGTGYPAPSGTGSYTAPPPQFTGAASGLKVGGALAGVGAVAAFFL